MPCGVAMAMISLIRQGCPARWTGITALVRGVMAAGEGLRVQPQVGGVDVGQHRPGPAVDHGGQGGDEGHRRQDDLVPRADTHGLEGQEQAGRTAGHRHGVGNAQVVGAGLAELAAPSGP